MPRSFSLEEQASLFSREGSFDQSSIGPLTIELRLLSHEEPRPEGYDEYFDPPLESKYECPICFLGLREPVQTICGHIFCRGCIVRSIRDVGPKCPVDNERLSESQLYPDNFARREILSREVFCRMKKQRGCPWKGPLGKLEDHLNECPYVDEDCPNQCGKKLQRKDLQQHMEEDCPLKRVPCKYCKELELWNAQENHYQDCPKYPQQCDKCGKENIPRDKMNEHLEKECLSMKIKCPFAIVGCSFEGLRLEVNKHVQEELSNHAMYMAKKISAMSPESGDEEAPRHRDAAIRRARGGIESSPQEQANQEGFFNELSTRIQRQQSEIDEMRRVCNRLETNLLEYDGRVCNGVYIWRIENYRQRREDAINGIMTTINSPAFYTNLYGYKLCMRINLNGVDSGEGTHVALFVHMMQGDYDTILKWPFTGRISLSIMDQSDGAENRQHISETFVVASNNLAFQKPTVPCNYRGYGYGEFAPIEQIREPQYVKHNTMLVRIQVFHNWFRN